MPMLPDGTVVPSFMSLMSTGADRGAGHQTNTSLRWGEVVARIDPNDERNHNGKFTEYGVRVIHKDGGQHMAQLYYNAVQLSSLFGGVADYTSYTLRPETKAPEPGKLSDGSKVLLLCINGDTHQAIILGGLRDASADADAQAKANGHHLDFEFNGLSAAIADDGSLTLTFNGKTKADGNLDDSADADAQGSTVQMLADGGVLVRSPDHKQSVFVDHANSKVVITGDSELDLVVNGPVSVQSTGVTLGGGTNAMLLASNYRFQEQVYHQLIAGLAQAMSTLMTTAGAALTAAAATTPAVAPAGTALTAAGPLLASWAAAIQAMEAQAQTFLSPRNFND